MTMTNLGSGFTAQRGLSSVDALSILESFAERVESTVESRVMDQVRTALAALQQPAPQVTVQPASVSVAAPAVSIAPVLEATVELDDLCMAIAGLRIDLQAHMALLARPVTRTIHRDPDGLITAVTESR